MTVSTSSNSITYVGDGVATVFPVPFMVILKTDFTLSRQVVATGAIDLTYNQGDFSVAGLGNPAGCTITLGGTALSNAYRLIIRRIVPYTQLLDINNQGGFYLDSIEQALDLEEMQIQQLIEGLSRTLQFPLGDTTNPILPAVATRANKFFGFDIAGNISMQNLATQAISGSATVTSIALLAAIAAPTNNQLVYVGDLLRGGWFRFDSANLSALVTADPLQGLVVAPTAASTGASGAWRRIWDGDDVYPEWFGGAGDYNGAAGTDNLAVFNAIEAINLRTIAVGYEVCPGIKFRPGWYHCSAAVNKKRISKWEGTAGAGFDISAPNGGSALHFPIDIDGLVINDINTLNRITQGGNTTSARGSIIKNLAIAATAGGSDANSHGVRIRTNCFLENVTSLNFENGFHINTQLGGGTDLTGSASESKLIKCFAMSARGHGMYISGADANAMSIDGFKCRAIGLCGIKVVETFGNFFSNLIIHGYAERAPKVGEVSHGGRWYVLIDHTAGIGSATTPGSSLAADRIWLDIGAAGGQPAWSALGTYQVTLPIYSSGDSNRSKFNDVYVEGNLPIHIRGAGSYHGGLSNQSRYSQGYSNAVYNAGALVSNLGWCTNVTFPPTALPTSVGAYQTTYYGTAAGGPGPGNIWWSRHNQGAVDHDWSMLFDDQGNLHIEEINQSTHIKFLGKDNTNFADMGKGTAAQAKGFVMVQKLAIANETSGGYRAIGVGQPDNGRTVSNGEHYFNGGPSPSGKGAKTVTTAGILGSTAVVKDWGPIVA